MILMDYIFRISLGLAILFFGIAVAYFFGMNVKKMIFDVKEMEDNMPKEVHKGKQVVSKLETENIKMARKQKNDSGRMKLSKNKEEKVPRTKDGFVDMDRLTPQEKPMYIHDKKGKLHSNQVPFVDEDDIYDPNNDATGEMSSSAPVKKEENATSYLEPEEDVGTSYLDSNDGIIDEDSQVIDDDPLNNQFTGVTEEDLAAAEEEQTDETSFLGEEDVSDGTTYLNPEQAETDYTEYLEPEEKETDHTTYLEPEEEEEEIEDGTSFLESEEPAYEEPAPVIEEEEEEDNATSMLTSEEYPGYSYGVDGYHDDAELELEDIGEQVEDGTTFLNQEELGIVEPEEDLEEATSYLNQKPRRRR